MISQRFCHGMHIRLIPADSPAATILYIHGLGESGLCLERIMGHPLLKGFSHLSADLPGYGKSPWPEKPLSLSEQADLLARLLNTLGISRTIILGHSMGGVIGTIFCERYPQMVSVFINVEGNVSFEDCTFSCVIFGHNLHEFIDRDFDAYRDKIYESSISEKALRFYHASLLMCDPHTIYENSRELVELSRREELAERLGSLPMPVIYIWGNPRGTQAYSRSLLNKANVALLEINDAGHWPFIDQPDVFAENLLAVLP